MFFSITTYNFLTTDSKLKLASVFRLCLSSLHSLTVAFAVLQRPCQGNLGKFQGSGERRLGGSEKDRCFLKIPKGQHKPVRNYKRGKLVSYFLNNATKTCLYGLKLLENIEIEHVFQPKALFHISSNLHTSCLRYNKSC